MNFNRQGFLFVLGLRNGQHTDWQSMHHHVMKGISIMKQQEIQDSQFFRLNSHALILGTAVLLAISLSTQTEAATRKTTKHAPVQLPVSSTIELAPQINATIGKSTLLRLPAPASRISVGKSCRRRCHPARPLGNIPAGQIGRLD
jgi:hypothetical protein